MKRFLIAGYLVAMVIVAGCGSDNGESGSDPLSSTRGPDSGYGSLWIVSPSNTGSYQTTLATVGLKGGSFVPEGASCPNWTGVLPPNFKVTWFNSANGATGVAFPSLGCVLVVINAWETGNYIPLSVGDNRITVTADDSYGNTGRDTIVVTRLPI